MCVRTVCFSKYLAPLQGEVCVGGARGKGGWDGGWGGEERGMCMEGSK